MLLKSIEGEYLPSFFIIQLDTTQEVNVAIKENSSTFVHEYIHFLQDLTLPYCMRENLVCLSAFFDYKAAFLKNRAIHLPNTTLIDDYDLAKLITKMTWGSVEFIESVAASNIERINMTFEKPQEKEYRIYQYDLVLDNNKTYQLGARDLLEYIAHKIESKHFPGEEKLPDLPYHSLDILVNYYKHSDLSEFKRIVLAEYCLLNDNPIHSLMLFFEELRNGSLPNPANQSDEDFAKMLSKLHWRAWGHKYDFETIGEKINRRSLELKNYLQQKFPEDSLAEVYLWLDKTIDFARNNLAGKSFFAELFALEKSDFIRKTSDILNEIGIPLIVNTAGEIGTSLGGDQGKDQFIQLFLAYEFTEYLNRDEIQCPMSSVCERDNENLINDDCLNAPFRRALRNDLCPFGVFIKTHGFDQVSWYVKDRLIPGTESHWR